MTVTGVVSRGDSPWKIAERNLKAKGGKVSNGDIVKEMERLASINGCDSVDDFSREFFYSTGKTYVIDNGDSVPGNTTPTKPGNTTPTKPGKTTPTKPVTPTVTKPKHNYVAPPTAQEVTNINNLSSDSQRIIEYNKKHYSGQYYGIVDKKNCKLNIYDKNGKVVKSFTIGVGKKKGDNLGSYYLERAQQTPNAHLAETGRYTTAGEFTLDEVSSASDSYTGKDGKPKIMYLKGDNKGVRSGQMAIHMLYKPNYKQRLAAINSPGLEDNRMSYGCVNLTEEDYNLMHQYLGEGDKIFVLPEEQGNKLLLEKKPDGTYYFAQQYHKSDERSHTLAQASAVNYDINPDRNPFKLKQEHDLALQREKEEQERQAEEAKRNAFCWYNPSTWFS